MLKDFLLGEHLLLVGNQGVGKNKIVDRFLYLLNRPREYLQLHRYYQYFFCLVLSFSPLNTYQVLPLTWLLLVLGIGMCCSRAVWSV